MIMDRNEKIREALKNNRIPLWQLADLLGVSESTVTRMMRHELPEEKREEILTIIRRKNSDD